VAVEAQTVTAQRIPAAAAWLGAAGILPFLALAVALVGELVEPPVVAARALIGYGAVILSFLGGIQWGLGIAGGATEVSWARLGWSVLPALAAWVGLLLPLTAGLVLLAVAFMVVLGADVLLQARELTPPWYVRLRLPLTTIVTVSLLVAAAI
jgi:hypothetical protein